MTNCDQSDASDDTDDEDRDQCADRRQHATKSADPTEAPLELSLEVSAPVVDVVDTNDEQVDTHQEIGQRQVANEEGVDSVILEDEETAEQDEDVDDNGRQGRQPDADAQDDVVQQMEVAGDAVTSWFTHAYVKGVSAQVEVIEFTARSTSDTLTFRQEPFPRDRICQLEQLGSGVTYMRVRLGLAKVLTGTMLNLFFVRYLFRSIFFQT